MKESLIVVVNEIGREKNPIKSPNPSGFNSIEEAHLYHEFEETVKTYPAPNIPDGEHRAYLQWQWQNPYTPNKRWEDEPNEANHEHSMSHGYKTQQIWKLSEEQQPEGETPIIKRLENLESVVANLTSLVNELAIAVRKRLEKPTT